MKKNLLKNFKFYFLIIIIISFIIIFVVFRTSKKELVLEESKLEIVKTLGEWQKYEQLNNVFSFLYPKNWIIDDSSRHYVCVKNEKGEEVICITSGNLTFDSWFPTEFCINNLDDERCEKLETDNYSAFIDWGARDWGSNFLDGARGNIVIPEKYTPEDWILILTLYKLDSFSKDIFRKIISSFEFIIPNIDVSDWQIYQNKEYNFELKYPSNWEIQDMDWLVQIYPGPKAVSQKIDKRRSVPIFTINIWDNYQKLNLEEVFEEIRLDLTTDLDPNVRNVQINDFNVLTFQHFVSRNRCYILLNSYQDDKVVLMCFNNEEYDLRGFTYIQTFYQILFSFKILENI